MLHLMRVQPLVKTIASYLVQNVANGHQHQWLHGKPDGVIVTFIKVGPGERR